MELRFLGGADEVGASCTLIEIDGQRILVDAGIRMGPSNNSKWPGVGNMDKIDALLLTHAHSDHTGSLPLLAKENILPEKVYCTHPTKQITQVLLEDALKRVEKSRSPEYTSDHASCALSRMSSVSWMEPVQVSDCAKATWIPAGHILGAGMIYLEGKQDSILVTGDVSGDDQLTIPGIVIPEWCRPDVIVMESTYGNRQHKDRACQENALVQHVTRVTEAGGRVLIPAFAVGRSQEVILVLKDSLERRQIPLYVDGMVRRLNDVYSRSVPDLKPSLQCRAIGGGDIFYSDFVRKVESRDHRERILSGPPCCIVASSGMLNGGVSNAYAGHFAGDPENLIAIVGYQGEGTPGRALVNLSKAKELEERKWKLSQKEYVNVRCEVKEYSLSAHADRMKLTELVERLSPKKCFLVHGDDSARKGLAESVRNSSPTVDVRLPENGRTYTYTKRAGITNGKQFGNYRILAELNSYLQKIGATGPFRARDLAEYWFGTEATTLFEEKLFQLFLTLDRQEVFVRDRQSPHLFRLGWIV